MFTLIQSNIKYMKKIRWLLLLSFISCYSLTSQSETEALLPSGLIQLPISSQISSHIFVVDKTARELIVYESNGEQLKTLVKYPTDIGKGSGNKVREGDFKTPEGIYFLQEKLNGRELNYDLYGSLAFTTNYPNYFDAKDGKTGYGIWLHAIPDKVPLTRGSRGCVVVRDNVIKELSQYIKLERTPVLIYDKIDYVASSEIEKSKTTITQFLDSWKKAWESQNVEDYISYYDENFTAKNMNLEKWKKYKRGLNEKYDFVRVDFSTPVILKNKNQIIIKVEQTYTSDKHTDFGEKTVFAIETANGIKILGEDWAPLKKAQSISNSEPSQPVVNN